MTVILVLLFCSIFLSIDYLKQAPRNTCPQEQEILPDMLPAFAVA